MSTTPMEFILGLSPFNNMRTDSSLPPTQRPIRQAAVPYRLSFAYSRPTAVLEEPAI